MSEYRLKIDVFVSCVEQLVSQRLPCIRFFADFCRETKDIFV